MLVDSQTHLRVEDQENDDELARYLAKCLYSSLLMFLMAPFWY